MSASVSNSEAAHAAEMTRAHHQAHGHSPTSKTHTYNTPHDAWAHAIELHKRGVISTGDLKRVRHELESHLNSVQQHHGAQQRPRTLADLGKRF